MASKLMGSYSFIHLSVLDKNNNIIHMLCVAIDLEGSPEIIQLAETYEMVFMIVVSVIMTTTMFMTMMSYMMDD